MDNQYGLVFKNNEARHYWMLEMAKALCIPPSILTQNMTAAEAAKWKAYLETRNGKETKDK